MVDTKANETMSNETVAQSRASLRWSVYLLLIAVAVGNLTGRLLAVNSVSLKTLESQRISQRLRADKQRYLDQGLKDETLETQLARRKAELQEKLRLQRPFLSANDRSRWLTIRSLVEHGTYEIDAVTAEPGWDTIDMVQHTGRDGQLHLYSSKPPLLPTLLAGEYWLIRRVTGMTLGTHPYEVGRLMLVTINILPMVLMFVLVAKLAEQLGTTDWGRLFIVAIATLGTMLNTFAVVLNNHTIAAVSATVAIYAVVQIAMFERRSPGWFVVAGLAAAFTAANELPALAFLALVGLWLLSIDWRSTLTWFMPAAALVAVAFFATNYVAHQTIRPPYAHRSATNPADNWYEYSYTRNGKERQSYWSNRQGIDGGEPCRGKYALHVLVGHHGIFSLTPAWFLSIIGCVLWIGSPDSRLRQQQRQQQRRLAWLVLLLTTICLVFYIGFRPQSDRNYGGMTSGFRWMFWFAPLWLVVMLPAADRLARSRVGQAFAMLLLAFSVFSVSFPTWNPWTQPWIYQWMEHLGWQGF